MWFSNLGFDFANKDLDHLVTGRKGRTVVLFSILRAVYKMNVNYRDYDNDFIKVAL